MKHLFSGLLLFDIVTGSSLRDLGTLPGHEFSQATAISASGFIAGWSAFPFPPVGPPGGAFLTTTSPSAALVDIGPFTPTDISELIPSGTVTIVGARNGRASLYQPFSGTRDLGVLPGCGKSKANAVNRVGTVVGTCSTGDPDLGGKPFVWTSAFGMLALDLPSGTYHTQQGAATALNNRDDAVGWSRTVAPPWFRKATPGREVLWEGAVGVLWKGTGAVVEFGAPPGASAFYPTSINDDGVVVGYALYLDQSGLCSATDCPFYSKKVAYMWSNDRVFRLGEEGGWKNLLWDRYYPWDEGRRYSDFSKESIAKAINNSGYVVGEADFVVAPVPRGGESDFGRRSFVWTPGGGVALLPSAVTALDINDAGEVVGDVTIPAKPGSSLGTVLHAALLTLDIFPTSPVTISFTNDPPDRFGTIDLDSQKALAVNVLGDANLDPRLLDLNSVTLGSGSGQGTGVARLSDGTLWATGQDVNQDGIPDLTLLFRIPELVANGDLTLDTFQLVLRGHTQDGLEISGAHSVRVVSCRGERHGQRADCQPNDDRP